jgi:thioredoxin reductase
VGGLTGPHPPGDYDVVVVGTGPGGLQTAYWLRRFGVAHALLSADDGPGGMFRRWPIFQRLITRSKPDAPFPRGSREYEWFDHNSLVADEPTHRAFVAKRMDRRSAMPARPEMEAGLSDFAEATGTVARYGCRWETTRREPDGRLVLGTTDGEYRCRAAVFAIGMTDPWRLPVPGMDAVPHYVDTAKASEYAGKRVFIVGKRNSAFEVADALLPWASQIVLASPRPVDISVLSASSVASRYLQPLEDRAFGRGTLVLDASVESVERRGDVHLVHARETATSRERVLETDAVIAATGFTTPLRDLGALGVRIVGQGRVPSLTPFFESESAAGVFFAGNCTRGARGLAKNGVPSRSSSVFGFRYNARVVAEQLAERLGVRERPRPRLSPEEAVTFLAGELARGPELWSQKAYLAHAVLLEGDTVRSEGIVPLEHFVDEAGPDALAVAVEMDAGGRVYPCVYLRRGARIREVPLDPDPLDAFDGPAYRDALARLLAGG